MRNKFKTIESFGKKGSMIENCLFNCFYKIFFLRKSFFLLSSLSLSLSSIVFLCVENEKRSMANKCHCQRKIKKNANRKIVTGKLWSFLRWRLITVIISIRMIISLANIILIVLIIIIIIVIIIINIDVNIYSSIIIINIKYYVFIMTFIIIISIICIIMILITITIMINSISST